MNNVNQQAHPSLAKWLPLTEQAIEGRQVKTYLERSNATLLDAGMPFDERKDRLAAMLAAKVSREALQ